MWCKYCGCRLDLDGCGQWQSRRQVRPGEEPSSSSSTAVHLHYHHPLEFCHQDHLPRHLSDHPDSLTAMLHFHHLEVCHQHHCQLCFCHQHQHHPDICHQNKQCCIIIIQSFVTSNTRNKEHYVAGLVTCSEHVTNPAFEAASSHLQGGLVSSSGVKAEFPSLKAFHSETCSLTPFGDLQTQLSEGK